MFTLGITIGMMVLFSWYRWRTRVVHIHAGFIVYADSLKEDFTQIKYMKLEKCGKEEDEDEQLEKAHLHDNVGDVVHVHRRGAKWGDLFKNIKYNFPEGELVGYINGKRINGILNYPIKAYDSSLFVVGKDNGVNKSEVITIERIKEVEGMVENCGMN